LEKKQGKQGKEEEKSGKAKYWFDGFDFIPIHQSQGGSHHQFLFAWQNSEGLSEKTEIGGQVYVYDLLSNPEKPKFSV
jgi:hypothetical protein